MRYFILVVFFGFASSSYSQKVSGTILDMEGKPVPFASVFIKGTQRGTNANAEGKYFLELDPGTYTLVCQHVNYKQEEKVIVCGTSDIVLNFRLSLQEVILQTVTVGNKEDPAYEVIRNTIKKRAYHLGQLDNF